MNPGLVVKLRPTGPWRIGPDSGARNRVDFIYHSDSLYSAVAAAMARLGWLEDWLFAAARAPVLAGRMLDDNQWSVDGPSECLVPAGRPGPFRTALRWSAAVDRLTRATERH